MVKRIYFIWDNDKQIKEKMDFIETVIGTNNMVTDCMDNSVPELLIKCNKTQWKKIRFRLDLGKVYA